MQSSSLPQSMKPLLLRELKTGIKPFIFWSLGMIFTVVSGMAKYAVYKETNQGLNELISQFPSSIQHFLGLAGFDLSKALGYFGVLFGYLILLSTIHAINLGVELIQKEERDRTVEFLIPKPISRNTVITAKYLSGIMNIITLNFVTLITSVYVVAYFNNGISHLHELMILFCGMFFTQLIFFSIGTTLAATAIKSKKMITSPITLLLFAFLLNIAIGINNNLAFLSLLTPFSYFEASKVIQTHSLDILPLIFSAMIVTISLFATYHFYSKKDFNCT